MKIDLQKKISTGIGFALMVLVMTPFVVYALGTNNTGYRIDAQTSTPIAIDAHSECWNVKNEGSTLDYFIPTRLANEWTAFRAKYAILRPADIYPCSLPNSQCRLHYQSKIDTGLAPIKTTGWTTNSTTYASGAYSLKKTGQDDHCNGSTACGIRVGVECIGDYGINVTYEAKFEGISGGVRTTGYAVPGGGINWGAWSERQYETGDNECNGSGNCRVSMTVEDNYSGAVPVTCSIGYQHRTDESQSGWRYDGVEAIANNNGSGDGENCEGGGCGLQARLYCAGPPQGPGGGSPPPGVDGVCGPASGQLLSSAPPVSNRCSSGTQTGFTTTSESWFWACSGSGTGSSDFCEAFNLGGFGGGDTGIPGGDGGNTQLQ